MNPIDGLVDAACSMTNGQMFESIKVIQGAIISARALSDSFIAALGDAGSFDLFRAEFRLPSESRDLRQEPEVVPQQPVSIDVTVNTAIRQIRDAIGDIQADSVNIPSVYSGYALKGLSREVPRQILPLNRRNGRGLAEYLYLMPLFPGSILKSSSEATYRKYPAIWSKSEKTRSSQSLT